MTAPTPPDPLLQRTPRLFAAPHSWGAVDSAFAELWARAQDIPGWLSEGQARILYRAATQVPEGQAIVEIGSHHGRSTVFLASAKSPKVSMLAVDPFDNPRWGGGPESWTVFHSTLERFSLTERVEAFRDISAVAAREWSGEPVGLLFVDGAHDRQSVLADVDGWERFVAPGGLVIFHDAFSSIGVTQALTERHLVSRQFQYVGSERTLVAFRKADLTSASVVRSAISLTPRYLYFARNVAIKLSLRRRWTLVPQLLGYNEGDDLY